MARENQDLSKRHLRKIDTSTHVLRASLILEEALELINKGLGLGVYTN